MPHFGLMDAGALGREQAALQRARLHVRGGRRRLGQGKISAGIVTLYDALECGLEWFFASSARREKAGVAAAGMRESGELFADLVAAGVLEGSFDFDAFDALTVKALHEDLEAFDPLLLEGFERVMTDLGVMPFDEGSLPPEDPATF